MYVALHYDCGSKRVYECDSFALVPGPDDDGEMALEVTHHWYQGTVRKFNKDQVTLFIMNNEGKTIQSFFRK